MYIFLNKTQVPTNTYTVIRYLMVKFLYCLQLDTVKSILM